MNRGRLVPRVAVAGKARFEIQAQMFNAFNRHRFVNFEPNFSSPNFGATRGTNLPRFIQTWRESYVLAASVINHLKA